MAARWNSSSSIHRPQFPVPRQIPTALPLKNPPRRTATALRQPTGDESETRQELLFVPGCFTFRVSWPPGRPKTWGLPNRRRRDATPPLRCDATLIPHKDQPNDRRARPVLRRRPRRPRVRACASQKKNKRNQKTFFTHFGGIAILVHFPRWYKAPLLLEPFAFFPEVQATHRVYSHARYASSCVS